MSIESYNSIDEIHDFLCAEHKDHPIRVKNDWRGRKYTYNGEEFALNALVKKLYRISKEPQADLSDIHQKIDDIIKKINFLHRQGNRVLANERNFFNLIAIAIRRFFGNFFFNRSKILEKIKNQEFILKQPQNEVENINEAEANEDQPNSTVLQPEQKQEKATPAPEESLRADMKEVKEVEKQTAIVKEEAKKEERPPVVSEKVLVASSTVETDMTIETKKEETQLAKTSKKSKKQSLKRSGSRLSKFDIHDGNKLRTDPKKYAEEKEKRKIENEEFQEKLRKEEKEKNESKQKSFSYKASSPAGQAILTSGQIAAGRTNLKASPGKQLKASPSQEETPTTSGLGSPTVLPAKITRSSSKENPLPQIAPKLTYEPNKKTVAGPEEVKQTLTAQPNPPPPEQTTPQLNQEKAIVGVAKEPFQRPQSPEKPKVKVEVEKTSQDSKTSQTSSSDPAPQKATESSNFQASPKPQEPSKDESLKQTKSNESIENPPSASPEISKQPTPLKKDVSNPPKVRTPSPESVKTAKQETTPPLKKLLSKLPTPSHTPPGTPSGKKKRNSLTKTKKSPTATKGTTSPSKKSIAAPKKTTEPRTSRTSDSPLTQRALSPQPLSHLTKDRARSPGRAPTLTRSEGKHFSRRSKTP